MSTQHVSIRIPVNVVVELDKVAEQQDRSRNYIIGKFLKEKIYELTAGDKCC